MRRKTFYVVNLDSKRIIFLVMFLVATISSFFILGLSLGKRSTQNYAQKIQIIPNQANSNTPSQTRSELLDREVSIDTPEDSSFEEESFTQKKELEQKKVEISNSENSNSPPEEKVEIISLDRKQPQEQFPLPTDLEQVAQQTSKKTNSSTKKKKKIPQKVKKAQPSSYFTIQLAAFKSENGAKKLKEDIESKNKVQVYITQNKKGYYLVRVGKESSRKKIDRILRRLKSGYKKTAIILKV